MVAKPKVSIIGVGCTRFGSVLSTPELKNKTMQELITEACQEAMTDAGVSPKKLDALYVGHYQPHNSHQYSLNTQVMDWIGMNGKPSMNFASACSTTNSGLGLAADAIKSGRFDCVLVTAGEILSAAPAEGPGEPKSTPLEMKEVPVDLMYYYTAFGIDQIYTAYNAPGGFAEYQSFQMIQYAKKYGLTIEQMDEIECNVRKVCRKHGSLNPKALFQTTLEQEAKKEGFDNVLDYWKSSKNPMNAWPARVKGFLMPADGASAYIVCNPKIAKKLSKKTPVDLIGHAWDGSNAPWASKNFLKFPFDARAVKKAYKMAGVKGKDLDYLYCHDCSATIGHLVTPELMGYLPKGKAWKAVEEGRTLYSGDKPMTTSGGRNALGHAYAASAGAEVYEIVKQMRGEAGKRQIKDEPRIAAQQNHGAMLHTAVSVFRRRD